MTLRLPIGRCALAISVDEGELCDVPNCVPCSDPRQSLHSQPVVECKTANCDKTNTQRDQRDMQYNSEIEEGHACSRPNETKLSRG